ncbi:Crp/Fnr family transcriptional regulator [Brevundimonas sp. 374]|uniref:Crp/Fnr family transcriptional regulator n=1 Tax=Brevundimonas sp. 374 TaxID=1150400 RepID=UPI0008915740|nr:Crp/Fnr family transcriptional regulator [Brevundimonas sp. 374]SDQ77719.1 cAMP-binding domain of CRP or a regulatory subunit of cAMP-dependent protein kinases [Brevundimonas sp. 374]
MRELMNRLSPGNRLIQGLNPDDRDALLAIATPVEFAPGHVFSEPDDAIEHLHFIDSGFCSSVAVLEDGRTVETVMIGREGVLGVVASVVPHHAHTRSVAQVVGTARRVDAAKFRALSAQRPGVRDAVAEYMARLQGELEQSAACNALHHAGQRFAKWLLRCHDRVEGDTLNLTQEYLASMLGSQRTTVNEAAQGLQKAGAIAYSRGRITVLDRAALERAACECYRRGGDRQP